jgi:hypothetical protein
VNIPLEKESGSLHLYWRPKPRPVQSVCSGRSRRGLQGRPADPVAAAWGRSTRGSLLTAGTASTALEPRTLKSENVPDGSFILRHRGRHPSERVVVILGMRTVRGTSRENREIVLAKKKSSR